MTVLSFPPRTWKGTRLAFAAPELRFPWNLFPRETSGDVYSPFFPELFPDAVHLCRRAVARLSRMLVFGALTNPSVSVAVNCRCRRMRGLLKSNYPRATVFANRSGAPGSLFSESRRWPKKIITLSPRSRRETRTRSKLLSSFSSSPVVRLYPRAIKWRLRSSLEVTARERIIDLSRITFTSPVDISSTGNEAISKISYKKKTP